MGENNYQNQYNQYTTQNYSFVQYQLQQTQFPNTMLQQNSMLTASFSTPVYNTGTVVPANQSVQSASQSAPSLLGPIPYNNLPMSSLYQQSQIQNQSQLTPFSNTVLPQGGQFTPSTSTLIPNTGAPPNQATISGIQPAISTPTYGYLPNTNKPPPSYQQSQTMSQSQPMSFYNTGLPQGGQFTVSTSMPVPNAGAPSNQATVSGIQPSISATVYTNKPPPLYQQSQTMSQSQPMSFSNTRLPQGGQFTVSTSMPGPNAGAPSNQATVSGIQPSISATVHNNKPPSSYQQSQTLNQPQQKPFSNTGLPQKDKFTVSTSTIPNTGAPSNQATSSGIKAPSSTLSQQYDDDEDDGKPPPSYEESKYDRLIRRSKSDSAYSALDNNGGDTKKKKENLNNESFSNLFDIPEQSKVGKNESFNTTQKHRQDYQEKFSNNTNYYQHSSTTFPSEHGGSFNSRFLQGDQKGFGKYNQNYRGGFRGRRNEQNRGRSGNWQEYKSYQSNNRGWPGDVRNLPEYSSHQSNNRGWPGDVRNLPEYSSHQSENRGWPGDGRNLPECNSYQSEEKSFSEDHYDDRYEEGEQGDFEGEGDGEGNEEYNNEDGDGVCDKTNAYIPDVSLLTKYEYFPPSPEEMGEIFKDVVIYFFFKTAKNKKESNPFVVICESFRRSERYTNLEVEDGYDPVVKDRKFCTLRYQGMMLVRGVGENNCIKEARVRAGVELINKLAMTCYTLESKGDYYAYKPEAWKRMKEKGSEPGVYTIVPEEEIQDLVSAKKYLERVLSEEDTDVEYIFPFRSTKLALSFKSWIKWNPKLCARIIKDGRLGVSRTRTPQYWRDRMLADGTMETEKFKLKPPQGIGRLLLSGFDFKNAVVQLKNRSNIRVCELSSRYGPPGVGPRISRALPPWSRRGNNKHQKNLKKENQIINKMRRGEPAKGYKFLNKKRKQRLKNKLSLLCD